MTPCMHVPAAVTRPRQMMCEVSPDRGDDDGCTTRNSQRDQRRFWLRLHLF